MLKLIPNGKQKKFYWAEGTLHSKKKRWFAIIFREVIVTLVLVLVDREWKQLEEKVFRGRD